MELYFSPLACSLASRIAFYEAGKDVKFHQVDGRAKRLADGSDYRAVNALGQVPVLKTDDGELVTENPVVLETIADALPGAALAPSGARERARMRTWLDFTTSELHKLVFTPLLDSKSNDGAREFARAKAEPLFAYLNERLKDREFLLDRFSVADAYLVTVLNWARPTGIDLSKWPNVKAYYERLHKRPSVAKAYAEELALYQAEQAKKVA